jgi:hypothetical protein
MEIAESNEQNENAHHPIRESVEPASKVTHESTLQAERHCSPSISTDAGMEIDKRDEQEKNAQDSIRESFEPGSNLTVESALH